MLIERHSYLDTSIDFIISDIIEYDIQSAGFTMIKAHNLLPQSTINYLDSLDKLKRNIAIGKIARKKPGFFKLINDHIKDYRVQFYIENELIDEDILSIKKDAIYTKKYCQYLNFDIIKDSQLYESTNERPMVVGKDNSQTIIKFIPKYIYSAYLYLDKKELYYNRNNIDVKGITDNRLVLHEEYIIKFLHEMITILTRYDNDLFKKKLVSFADKYKKRELHPGYYREFNDLSEFKVMIDGNIMSIDQCGDSSICDISYNYMHIIVPLLGLVI